MDKKKKENPNQKTLFQSWGNNKQTLKTEDRKAPNNDTNIIEIIDLDDDDDDDGLLAAALEMESIDPQIMPENINHLQNSSRAGKSGNGEVSNSAKPEETKEFEFLPGFDMENGNVWIYPTNYPIRDYQFQIVEEALYKNTLVTLPTGLGKTFIAAVLMYNYYRWYPQGKIIFMAPTKPLVAQQIEACYNIMGIPESHTAQMTGNTSPTRREEMWKNKRVFFLTPQVLQNDLSRGSCCADDVVLLVFDEAHKALGNHAYCQVVREVANYTKNFRVLALSATPGDDVKAVQQVMTNLLISHMELRSEDSPDIQPYTHSRTVEKVVVPLGDDIARIKTHFLKVLEVIVGRLFCNRALWQKDPQRVTKYMLLSGRDQFRKRNLEGYTNGQKGAIEGDFAMGISLYHAYELLHQHGILSFYNFIKAIMDGSKGMARAKTEIRRNSQFMEVLEELRESIECPPDETAETSALFSQFTSPRRRAMHKQPFDPSFKSHPKLLKLEEVIVEHFQKFTSDTPSTSTSGCNEGAAEIKPVNTRVMIFSQYRDSVGEITAILNRHKPLVRVMSFIGQATTGKSSRGLSQKEQLEVVQRFRRGGYNTLVATCVGEEGLDIGDVDLIVCFDAHASPIRLVQRMGRTGRKRNGRIVVLVSQGKEEQIYKRSLSSKKSIHKAIVQGSKSFELYDDNPRMIPRHLTPNVLKMQMTVGSFVGNSKKKRKSEASENKSGSIASFLGKPGTSKSPNLSRKDDGLLTYEELIYWQENFKLPDCEAGTTPQHSHRRRSRKSLTDPPVKELSVNEWMAWQNGPSYVHEITHSRRTEHLVEILEFIELHGENAEGGDDAYDVEMMTFLNEEDLLTPDDDDDAMIINDDDNDVQKDDPKSKTEKSKKKKKSDCNENDGEKKKSNLKQSNKTKSKKSKSVSPARQKARWREYLKMFENEDNDFDTGENESKNREEKPDEMPEILDVDGENMGKVVKEAEDVIPEDNDAGVEEEDDDAFEVSSQTFSQLLPPLTPQKVNVLRSRILTDVTDDHAKDVPLPPSLDSLDEISPISLDKNSKSCEKERAKKLRQDKTLSCRRKISQLNEPERELGERLTGGKKEKNLASRERTSWEIEEPPNFDLEFDFGNEMDTKWENGNKKNECKELTKNSSKTSGRNNLLEEPPELDLGNEFEELTSGEENPMLGNHVSSKTKTNLKVKSQTRNTVFLPKQTDLLVVGDDEDDFEEKPSPRSSKLKERSGFGVGIVCKNNTSEEVFDDEIDIEFGDDSLADGILADLVEEEFERNNHYMIAGNNQNFSTGTFKNSKDERKFSERNDLHIDAKDVENNTIGESHNSSNETAPKKSKLKLNSKDKSLDNSWKKSILKLGVFERNALNSTNNPCSYVADSEEIFYQPTREEMSVKTFENKSESRSILTKTDDIPGKSAQKKEDFNFKKPDAVLGNRSMKLNRNVNVSPKACRNTSHENAETGSPVLTSSPSRMSLKLNSKSNLVKKQDKNNRELSSCDEFENNSSNIWDIQKNRKQRCSPMKELRTSPCPAEKHSRSFDTSHNGDGAHRIDPYDSPILRKPLRERLANRGLEDVVNDIDTRKCHQKDEGTILSDEDSPVVRNKSKSRTLPYVAAISPLRESQNSQSRQFEVQLEESPVIRRHSKAKIRDGNVFAIAESDEEFETEDEEREVKVHAILDEEKGRTNAKGLHNRRLLVMASDSEEDFLVENKECVQGAGGRHAAQRKIVLQNSVKRKSLCSHPPAKKHKRLHANHFLDAEADISGSDIDDFTDDESDRSSEFDSFIDDSTQLTQRTPACRTSRNPRSPMDMGAVYRKSLMSPHARNLNFRTPNFRTDKNRYKMDFRPKRIGSESEAEETNAHESELENELGLDSGQEDFEEEYSEESFYEGDENENPKSVTLEISPQTQSQVRRPLKRAKRNYVLNDSTDEDVIVCKKTPLKTTTKYNLSSGSLQSTQAFNHNKPSTLPTVPPKTNSFVASSCIFTNERTGTAVDKASPASIDSNTKGKASEWKFNKRSSISSSDSSKGGWTTRERNRLSTTFDIDWDGNDSDLLEAVEGSDNKDSLRAADSTKNTIRSHTTAQRVQDHEMQDIAFAMAATDDDMNFEMSAEMPTFSLGLDFFGDEIEEEQQLSFLKPNRKQNHRAFATEKNTSVLKSPFAQRKQQEQPLAQRYGKQESKFTKIVPPQRSGESNTRAFSFKCSGAATVQPFNKGLQKSKTNPQNVVKNMSGGSTIFGGNSGSGTDGCGVGSGRVTTNKGSGLENSNGYTGIGTGKENQTSWVTDSNDRRRNSNNITSTPVKTMKNVPKAFVSPSQRDRDKMVILVDTKEICNAQVISCLRRKHDIKAEVCQLIHCDYVVSNRVGVIRKVVSALDSPPDTWARY